MTQRHVFSGIFICCAALLATAFYMEYVMGLEPCPLCWLQRYAFMAVGLIALAGAIHNPVAVGGRIYGVLLVIFAVAWGLMYKGVTGETLADAVKDIGGALVPIFAAIFAARLVQKDLPAEQRFLVEGDRALKNVQNRHQDHVQGPKYDRDGYDPEGGGTGDRYLFIQKRGAKERASLVALKPLAEGVVAVTVSKKNLKILGRPYESDEDVPRAQEDVRAAVTELMKKIDPQTALHEVLPAKSARVAIAVDLDEQAMSHRRFRRTVEQIVGVAIEALVSPSSRG